MNDNSLDLVLVTDIGREKGTLRANVKLRDLTILEADQVHLIIHLLYVVDTVPTDLDDFLAG